MDHYQRLQEILDTHPSGAPASEAFFEILRILFTPAEARVAAAMKFVPMRVTKIAEASGVPADEVGSLCEAMAAKGIVFSRVKDGESGYALLPTIPGLFEFPFMRGGGTPVHERLGELWEEYHARGMGQAFCGSPTPLARVIPVESLVETRTEVLPFEIISSMLDKCGLFALAQCACRVSVGKCDKPRDVCLLFDKGARFLIDRNLADEITREQAREVLARAEEAGLVHTTNNSRDRLNFICNCCPCCCTILRGLTELKDPNAFAVSRWTAWVDAELCNACGVCEDERCPAEAVKVQGDAAIVDAGKCIGCGLCATACTTGAIVMAPRENPTETPASVAEMGLKVVTEKGKLESFLKLMKAD